MKDTKKQDLYINFIEVHMNSQRLPVCMGHTWVSIRLFVYILYLPVCCLCGISEQSLTDPLFLLPSLGLFSFCLYILSNYDMSVFVLPYFIIFPWKTVT